MIFSTPANTRREMLNIRNPSKDQDPKAIEEILQRVSVFALTREAENNIYTIRTNASLEWSSLGHINLRY